MIWNNLKDIIGVGLWKLKASLPVGNKWKPKVVIKCPLLEEKNMNLSSVQSPRWLGSSVKQRHTCKNTQEKQSEQSEHNVTIRPFRPVCGYFRSVAQNFSAFQTGRNFDIGNWGHLSILTSDQIQEWRRGEGGVLIYCVTFFTSQGSFFYPLAKKQNGRYLTFPSQTRT